MEAEDFGAYRRYLEASGKVRKTVNAYTAAVRHFNDWCAGRGLPLPAATKEDVIEYLAPVYERQSWSSVEGAVVALRTFYAYGVAAGLCEENPTLGIPSKLMRRRPEKPFNAEGLRSLIARAADEAAGRRVVDPPAWATEKAGFGLDLLGRGLSQETVRTYVAAASEWARWCHREGLPLVRATRQQVQRYVAGELEKRSLSTVRNRLLAMRAFYRYLVASRPGRASDPTAGVKVKRPKLQPRRPYSTGELRALIAAALNPRDRALLLMLIASGARISEVLRLKAEDIEWAQGIVKLYGKGSKERWVAPGRLALEALRAVVNGRGGPVWLTREGKPVNRARGQKIVRALAARARIAGVYPHGMRVTFANRFLEGGGDLGALQVLMGHAQISQTAHYAGYNAAQRALEQQRRMAVLDRLEVP